MFKIPAFASAASCQFQRQKDQEVRTRNSFFCQHVNNTLSAKSIQDPADPSSNEKIFSIYLLQLSNKTVVVRKRPG
jgi:hypothetical protein